MMHGTFRDDHPRMILALDGANGDLEVEFVVDTGFAGDLSLPVRLVTEVVATMMGFRIRKLASGQQFRCPYSSTLIEWNGEARQTEILILEGEPLLGTELMREYLLQVEMSDGGETLIEPL